MRLQACRNRNMIRDQQERMKSIPKGMVERKWIVGLFLYLKTSLWGVLWWYLTSE